MRPDNNKEKIQVNWFYAVAGVNLQEALDGLRFEKKEMVTTLYAPEKNTNPKPEFKSIKSGLRQLDKNPQLAVLYFLKQTSKVTPNYENYFLNDNNAWT